MRIVAGLDIDERESRQTARRHARPYLNKWRDAARTYVKLGVTPKLERGDLALIEELMRFPSANHGYAYPSQQRIADHLGTSLRTSQRIFSRLIAAGFLIRDFRGQGRSARWTFAIAGRGLFEREKTPPVAGLDTTDVAGLDTTDVAGLDTTDVAYKPIELQPIEPHPIKHTQPEKPTPPPSMTPRDARRLGRELSTELLSGLTQRQRQHPRWRGLSIWITDQLERGTERVDIASGIACALPSLKGEPPSSLEYFRKPIERTRAGRINAAQAVETFKAGLARAKATPQAVSLNGFVSYIAAELCERPAVLARVDAAALKDLHGRFCAKAIDIGEAVATMRAMLTQATAK